MANSLRVICAMVCLLPVACATPGGGAAGFVMFDPNQHLSGAEPLFGTRGYQCDAASMMQIFAPEPLRVDPTTKQVRPPDMNPKTVDDCTRLRRSIAWTLITHPAAGQAASVVNYSKEARNEAIKMLLADSDQKCDRYKQFLDAYNGDVQAGSGILSQTASTIASLATGGLAKALSAGASITTNAGGQLGKAHFHDQTIPVIVQGINSAQKKVMADISTGMGEDVSAYPIGAGIEDAIRYHAQCTITAGLQEAQNSLSTQNPVVGVADELTKLEQLKTSGALTQAEFDAQKALLLKH